MQLPHGRCCPFYILEMNEELKVFVEDGLRGVVLIVGSVLLLCHTRLKGMLGGKYHITADLFCSNIWRLIIVAVSQDTVWEQGEFGRDAPTRCAKHVAQS